MKCQLITLSGLKYDGDFTEVLLTTTSGMMVALPHHEPMAAVLQPSPITIHNSNTKETFAVFGGLMEITTDTLKIMADTAEHSDELDQAEIEHALAEAEKMKASASTHHQLHHAQTMIDRAQVRLNVVHIRRNRSHHERPGQSN